VNVRALSKIGNTIRAVQDQIRPTRSPRLTESGIRWLVETTTHAMQARKRRLTFAFAGSGIVMTALLVALVLWRWPERIRFEVGPNFHPGIESNWIHARATQPVPLRFSDGSTVDLFPGTRGRVVRLTSHGAGLTVETGRVHASVVPRQDADWSIAAGPFSVQVVGTEFEVAWDPEAEVLHVDVERGVVRVTGPILTDVQQVIASQRLTVSLPERRAALVEAGGHDDGSLDLEVVPELSDPASSVDAGEGLAAVDSAGRADTDAQPSWQALARRGEHARALRIVERSGVERMADTLGPEQLLQLADVLRLGGRPAAATRILQRVRARFPGTSPASLAAYTLGVMAFDQRHVYADASNWFGTYLREQPTGALAREALGRQMEAQERVGRSEEAQAAARRYLQLFPDGPHRDIAKRLTHPRSP
jgi:transmembrane sensor